MDPRGCAGADARAGEEQSRDDEKEAVHRRTPVRDDKEMDEPGIFSDEGAAQRENGVQPVDFRLQLKTSDQYSGSSEADRGRELASNEPIFP